MLFWEHPLIQSNFLPQEDVNLQLLKGITQSLVFGVVRGDWDVVQVGTHATEAPIPYIRNHVSIMFHLIEFSHLAANVCASVVIALPPPSRAT